MEKERSDNSKLLRDYPGHESLWCYRRFVCQAFLVIAPRNALLGTTGAGAGTGAGEAAVPRNVAEAPSSSTTTYDGGFDWARWSRAAAEWHEGCVLEDDKAAKVLDSSEEEEEEEEEDGVDGEGGSRRGEDGDKESGRAAGGSGEADFEDPDGVLPGAPAGGGLLAEFLGREARFALKCAADKVCVALAGSFSWKR